MTQDERPASSTSDHARPIEARNLLLSPNVYPQEQKLCSDVAMLGTILLIVLILILVGALPTWPYSGGWGLPEWRLRPLACDRHRSSTDGTHLAAIGAQSSGRLCPGA